MNLLPGYSWVTSFNRVILAGGTWWQINANVIIEPSGSDACIFIQQGANVIKAAFYQLDSTKKVVNMSIDALVQGDGTSIAIGVVVQDPGTLIYANGSTIGSTSIEPPAGNFYSWFSAHRIA